MITRWMFDWADVGSEKLDKLLSKGWEPFAVVAYADYSDRVYLRFPAGLLAK